MISPNIIEKGRTLFRHGIHRNKSSELGLNCFVGRRLRAIKPSVCPADWRGAGLQGFWYGLGFWECSIVLSRAILVSQSTDKVSRRWLGPMGINRRVPWEVRSGIVSRGFTAGYSASLPPGWCGLSVSSTAAEFGEVRKRRQIPCHRVASVPYNIHVLNVEARQFADRIGAE